jgi:hypothetical protein
MKDESRSPDERVRRWLSPLTDEMDCGQLLLLTRGVNEEEESWREIISK